MNKNIFQFQICRKVVMYNVLNIYTINLFLVEKLFYSFFRIHMFYVFPFYKIYQTCSCKRCMCTMYSKNCSCQYKIGYRGCTVFTFTSNARYAPVHQLLYCPDVYSILITMRHIFNIYARDEKFYASESDCGSLRFSILKCHICYSLLYIL